MQEPPTKQAPESVNMADLNYPASPPPYSQSQPMPQPMSQPYGYPASSVVVGPGVAITQQPGMSVTHQGPRGPVTTTVIGNTVVQTMVVEPTVGSLPSLVRCRSCNHQIVTRVEYMPTGRTHITALLLCLFGCWPCMCLPYCMSSCQRANHYCTNCGAYVGAF